MRRTSHLAMLRNPDNGPHAKELRSDMSDAESRLWYYLRARRFQGWKFRREVPLGDYVVDFLCEEARLVVEVDGGQHTEQRAYDATRTRWLEAHGYRVVRYWNHEVLGNMEGVLEALSLALAPSPRPSPKGEGERR